MFCDPRGGTRRCLFMASPAAARPKSTFSAIQEVVRFGRQAIVLVPEISLTPQTKRRFAARFDHVAVLHSHLRDAERHQHWRRIAAGEVSVIVGARSAVSARAEPGADRPGRRARSVVQAGKVAPLSCPRRGPVAGQEREHSAGARLGHAVAGKLVPRLDRRISTDRNAPPRARPSDCPTWRRSTCGPKFSNRRNRGAISRQLHQAIERCSATAGR